MRITKNLRADQDNIKRFLAALGGASVELGHSKRARPSFFIFAHGFIHDYIEEGFFKKEDLLISGPGKYPEYNFWRVAGVAIDGKPKGSAEREQPPIDPRSLLP